MGFGVFATYACASTMLYSAKEFILDFTFATNP